MVLDIRPISERAQPDAYKLAARHESLYILIAVDDTMPTDVLPCSFSRFLALSVNRLPFAPLSAFLFPTKHSRKTRSSDMFGFKICFPVQRKKKKVARRNYSRIYKSRRNRSDLLFFFFLSLSLLSSSSLLIFFSFSCFPTMPFSQTFFATFFPTLLVTVGLLPRRKSFASSSILLHFFLISLSDQKILPSDSRVHFCISIRSYTCKVPSRIQRETFTFLQILLHPSFYFLLQE